MIGFSHLSLVPHPLRLRMDVLHGLDRLVRPAVWLQHLQHLFPELCAHDQVVRHVLPPPRLIVPLPLQHVPVGQEEALAWDDGHVHARRS